MADVQKEKGFVSIAHELLSAVLKFKISPGRKAVMLTVMDKTYGWQKKSDRISVGQISRFAGVSIRQVQKSLAELEARNMIWRSPVNGPLIRVIGIQKDFDQWRGPIVKTRSHRAHRPLQRDDPGHTDGVTLPRAPGHPVHTDGVTPSTRTGYTPSTRPPTNKKKKPLINVGAHAPPISRGSFHEPEPWALKLTDILAECLQGVSGARFPRGWRNNWARQIERMPAEIPWLRDMVPEKRSSQMELAIRWAFRPENLGQEYEVVIRCGKSFREKLPKLVAARQRSRKKVVKVESFRRQVEISDQSAG